MAGKRKLFIMHAQELAHRLVHSIAHGGLVEQFVRSYAERHNRRKLIGDPLRLRELESTIGREALLAIAVEVRRLVPRAFAQGGSKPGAEEIALGETFFSEFVASLGRALDWSAADAASEMQALQRDVEMYWGWSQRGAASPQSMLAGRRSERGRGEPSSEGPFRDRCAILLDPPMMEQARRAAAAFETEVVRVGIHAFDQLGRQHRRGAPPRSRHLTKLSRGAKNQTAAAKRLVKRGGKRSVKPVKPPVKRSLSRKRRLLGGSKEPHKKARRITQKHRAALHTHRQKRSTRILRARKKPGQTGRNPASRVTGATSVADGKGASGKSLVKKQNPPGQNRKPAGQRKERIIRASQRVAKQLAKPVPGRAKATAQTERSGVRR